MSKAESINKGGVEVNVNIDFMRSLVKQYSELGQWTSAFFWADAAAAAAGGGPEGASGDDVWLLASAMLARGELHRASHAVTSRNLHKRHLLCLGVAMRAHLAAREPATVLSLMEECDQMLLEPKHNDQTHNRALAGVLVSQGRALSNLERHEASAEALASALKADCACYEALDLLLDQHVLSPRQERELIESLPISSQLSGAEGALVRAAYIERFNRHAPLTLGLPSPNTDCPIAAAAEAVRSRTMEASACLARRLSGACRWREALAALDSADRWCCAEVRTACLVELKRTSELFAFAHSLVDAYPNHWTSWFAVGCYYYLIGKSEFARRYLSKAKTLEPSAGCVWLAYGHSFAADNEHDQAMAAYFKASQLMGGCHLPPLYVGVQCALLNNISMCEKFLYRAAAVHNNAEGGVHVIGEELEVENRGGWRRIAGVAVDPHVAHEAGAAAFNAGDYISAMKLFLKALEAAHSRDSGESGRTWAATLDGLGHAARALGRADEALEWHERALAVRPGRAATLAAAGLCLALLGRASAAADALHAALAADPDDVVAIALLDSIINKLDTPLTDEEIPQFVYPEGKNISVTRIQTAPPTTTPTPTTTTPGDVTNISDMSMSFD